MKGVSLSRAENPMQGPTLIFVISRRRCMYFTFPRLSVVHLKLAR